MNDKMNIEQFLCWLRGGFFFNQDLQITKDVASDIIAKLNYCGFYVFGDERLAQIKMCCELVSDGMDVKILTEKIKAEVHKPEKRITRS